MRQLSLQRKRLELNRQLGNLDGIAGADFDLARIDLAREDYMAAIVRLAESFQIYGRLQKSDGMAGPRPKGTSSTTAALTPRPIAAARPSASRRPGSRARTFCCSSALSPNASKFSAIPTSGP
jgi:hypothetical protein